jgi:glycosyltransferase involved in cell wall biosynthesis
LDMQNRRGLVRDIRTRVLFVGAFPPEGNTILGGNVTDCRILLESSFAERLELELVDTTQISNPPPSLPVRAILAIRRLIRFLWRFERFNPQVVFLFTSGGASVFEKGAMAWYASLRSVPAVMFPRGGRLMVRCERSRVRRFAVRAAFRSARKVFCQSERWQEFAVSVLGVPVRDAPVIPNWSATEKLLSIGRERQYQRGDGVRLLFLGTVTREKGVEELLLAVQRVIPGRTVTLDLVGDGAYAAEAKASLPTELHGRIRFRGGLVGEELEKALREADVLVLPSWAEGLPNAMIEAMASGLAVVTTPVGGIPDYVTDQQEALLVPPQDVDALAEALARLAEDDDLRERLGRNGHALAADVFSAEEAARRMVEVFDRLAEAS